MLEHRRAFRRRLASPVWQGPISGRTGAPRPLTAKRGRLGDATLTTAPYRRPLQEHR
jgi:hypothetical protein